MPVSTVKNKAHQRVKNIVHNNIPKSQSKGVVAHAVRFARVPPKGNKEWEKNQVEKRKRAARKDRIQEK